MLGDPNSTSSPARELTDDQQEMESPSNSTASQQKSSTDRAKDVHEEQKKEKEKESRTRKALMYLWEEGVSPFSIVRGLGVFGPMLVGRVSWFATDYSYAQADCINSTPHDVSPAFQKTRRGI